MAAYVKDSVTLLGERAREEEIKGKLASYDVLHFATHGVAFPESTLEQGLLLAEEPSSSSEDGVLYAWEVAESQLRAQLVVLSACESVKGKQQTGEGLMGLAWAFQAAGARNVLASLWNIDDQSTSRLMTSFYRAMKAGMGSPEAARRAMSSLRGETGYSQPFFWAAFQVFATDVAK